VKLDPDHEPLAAHFFDERVFRAQRIHFSDQKRAHLRGIFN
jgi:hypothetical protein